MYINYYYYNVLYVFTCTYILPVYIIIIMYYNYVFTCTYILSVYIYFPTNTGKYYELDTALPRVRRTSGTLYPTSNISWYLCDNKFIVYSPAHPV